MKKRIGALFLCVMLLLQTAGCGEQVFAPDLTTGTPWLDPSVQGNVTSDTPHDLKDNFALATDFDFYLAQTLEEGYGENSIFVERTLNMQQACLELLRTDNTDLSYDAKIAKDYYALLSDWETRNRLGVSPAMPYLDKIRSISSLEDVVAFYLDTNTYDIFTELIQVRSFHVEKLHNDLYTEIGTYYPYLTKYLYYSYYPEYAKNFKESTEEFVSSLLKKAGFSKREIKKLIRNASSFEEAMYEFESKDYGELPGMNDIMSEKEVNGYYPNLPLVEYLKKTGGKTSQIWVGYPGFLSEFSKYFTEEHLEEIKAYMLITTLVELSSHLDCECLALRQNYFAKVYGIDPITNYDILEYSQLESDIPWQLSRLYCDNKVSEEDKFRISWLVQDILTSYADMVSNSSFTDQTKKAILDKLYLISLHALYPDDWSLYECNELSFATKEEGGTCFDAYIALRKYNAEVFEPRVLKNPIASRWEDKPMTLNATYNISSNCIEICAGLFGEPLYSTDMSDEELYGAIGHTIAHEISHCFDLDGSYFDSNYNCVDLWSEEDRNSYIEKNEQISEYFSSFSPWNGQTVNGDLVCCEVFSDISAMQCMLSIASKRENFDYDTFFKAYANLFKILHTYEIEQERLEEDTHALAIYRVNGVVQQFDEFYQTYDINPGDGMYLAPEERIKIW